MEDPFRERRLPPAEIRRVLRRALEISESDEETAAAEVSMTGAEVLRTAAELGIPGSAIRRAMRVRDEAPKRVKVPQAEGGWLGHPLRTLLEEELDGEIGPEDHEELVDAIQVVTGDAGRVQVVGKTLTWQPTMTPQGATRTLTVTIRGRQGKTLVRVDEKHNNLAIGLYMGLGMGLGFGGGVPLFAGLLATFHNSAAIAGAGFVWLVLVSLFIARTLYTFLAKRRTRSHAELMARLCTAVLSAQGEPPVQTRGAAKKKKRLRVKAGAETEAETEAGAETEAETEAEADAEAEAEAEAEAGAVAGAKAAPGAKAAR